MRRFLPAFIGVLSFVVFIPALSGEFLTWDDDINLVSNTFYRGLGSSQIRWAFSNVRMGHYIPLTWLGLSANYAAGGMNPWGYHLVNVILHVANAVTFYFVARRLLAAAGDGGRQDRRADPALAWGAAVAALVFALHPLRVESVAWITERRDVQSGFFYLLSILTHLRSLEAGERARVALARGVAAPVRGRPAVEGLDHGAARRPRACSTSIRCGGGPCRGAGSSSRKRATGCWEPPGPAAR